MLSRRPPCPRAPSPGVPGLSVEQWVHVDAGTQTRSFSPLVGFGTRVLWVLLPRSCRACVQGSLLDQDGSRSPCGVRGARPALPEPTRASGSSQFSPAPSAASLRSLTCQVVTPQLVGGWGEEGRYVRPSGGGSWDLKTPSLCFWSIPACGQYFAVTSRTLCTLLTNYFISINQLCSFFNYRT